MGRIVDLLAEVLAAIEEGPEGLVLPTEDRERLKGDWPEAEIEDAITLVRDRLLQDELLDCADSLNTRLIDLLGTFGDEDAFRTAEAGQAVISLEVIGQLARRVDRLDAILKIFRDGAPPDRQALEALRQRLADAGIEADMRDEWPGMDDEEEDA